MRRWFGIPDAAFGAIAYLGDAIFGLAGAFLMLSARQLRLRGQSVIPVLKSAGALVLLNLILWWAMAGGLAWQAHLGGALAGIAFVALVAPRRA